MNYKDDKNITFLIQELRFHLVSNDETNSRYKMLYQTVKKNDLYRYAFKNI